MLAVNKNCARCTQILRDFTEAKTERENFHTGHEVVKLLVEKKVIFILVGTFNPCEGRLVKLVFPCVFVLCFEERYNNKALSFLLCSLKQRY